MQLKALASTIALAAALAISGPVYAQSMINGVTIPEDELPAVQQRCDDLKNAADTESLASEGQDTEGDEPVEDAGEAEVEDAPETDGTAEATTTVVDLDTIDLQACIDAGLVME